MEAERSQNDEPQFSEGLPAGLRSAAALHDPFEWYDERRRTGPVHYDDRRGVYDVFAYDPVKTALQDDERLVRKELSGSHGGAETPFGYIDNAMVWSDGSGHKGTKSQLFSYFRPDLLEGIRESVAAVAETQLETATADGPAFDFVSEFAVPVPLRVVMDVVGLPREDHDRVLTWLETFRDVMNSEYSAKGSTDAARMTEPVDYFKRLVERRRRDPREDLVSRLVTETDLSAAEIGANCFDFVLAGQGTMSEFLSNALYLFVEHDLVGAVEEYDLSVVLEEVLRYRAPLQARARETAAAVTIADTRVPAGETVILWIGAANRDPDRYDRSDAFLPERDPDHLAFGSGPHTCIGAPLARLQAPIVLRAFFEGVDAVEIDEAGMEPKPKASKLGFERLPVTVRPASQP